MGENPYKPEGIEAPGNERPSVWVRALGFVSFAAGFGGVGSAITAAVVGILFADEGWAPFAFAAGSVGFAIAAFGIARALLVGKRRYKTTSRIGIG